jgi:hypothetical protein
MIKVKTVGEILLGWKRRRIVGMIRMELATRARRKPSKGGRMVEREGSRESQR